jgi:hypothetical protein
MRLVTLITDSQPFRNRSGTVPGPFRNRFGTVPGPLARRERIGGLERAGKGLVCLEPRAKGDVDHRSVERRELVRSSLQSQPTMQLQRRFAQHAPKNAMEMQRRKTREPGELSEVQRLIQVTHDSRDRGANGLLVEVPRLVLHARKLASVARARLTCFDLLVALQRTPPATSRGCQIPTNRSGGQPTNPAR